MYIFQYQRLQQRLTLPQPLKPLQLLKVPQFLHSPFPQPTPQKQTPPPISYAFCPLPRESFLLQEFSNRSPAPDHRTESHSHTAEHNNCHIYSANPLGIKNCRLFSPDKTTATCFPKVAEFFRRSTTTSSTSPSTTRTNFA